ncbi:hypothetical protein MLD38_008860 [Melastoma candidum]|uniref:Uncharacterized protein n=1 Tax=Melastoma candidum TaxID=119954 RepID=A0ACB9S494_9MYRT|nr:hypothetical protein MLD38_008860 [Melastoma candidum]
MRLPFLSKITSHGRRGVSQKIWLLNCNFNCLVDRHRPRASIFPGLGGEDLAAIIPNSLLLPTTPLPLYNHLGQAE